MPRHKVVKRTSLTERLKLQVAQAQSAIDERDLKVEFLENELKQARERAAPIPQRAVGEDPGPKTLRDTAMAAKASAEILREKLEATLSKVTGEPVPQRAFYKQQTGIVGTQQGTSAAIADCHRLASLLTRYLL